MPVRKLLLVLVPALLIAGPALAKHGKVGLWNVTSTTEMAQPPAAVAAMKKSGQAFPASQPMTVQMCMSQEEVDSDQPPHLDRGATGCDTRITKQTSQSMSASMVCKGNMKGTGSIQVSYSGPEHYTGSYSFKGSTAGSSVDITTRFKGDWVKADCGKVKPYRLRTQ